MNVNTKICFQQLDASCKKPCLAKNYQINMKKKLI